MIHALIDATRVVGTFFEDGNPQEVCIEAIANHNRAENLLTVTLRAFLRSTEHGHLGETSIPDWLPASVELRESVGAEEAHELVEDILASWSLKVKNAIP